MATLKELYTTLKSLRDMKLPVDDKLLKAADELEEKIIKQEVLPALKEKIEPLLEPIQRELVLVVEHTPGEPLKVALSRKAKISDFSDAKPIALDPVVEHKEGKKGVAKKHLSPKTGLCVILPNGDFIQETKACDTLVEAIKAAGVMQVRALGYKYCHVPLVSNTIDAKYGSAQKAVGGGWYVQTHSNTKDKKKMLDKISKALNLGWKVEIIK